MIGRQKWVSLFVSLLLLLLPQIAGAFSCSPDVIYCPADPPAIDYTSYSGPGQPTTPGQPSTTYPYTKLMYCYGSKKTGAITSCDQRIQTLPAVYSRYAVYQIAYKQLGMPWASGIDLYSQAGMYGDLYANSSMWIISLFSPSAQNVLLIAVVGFS